MTYPQGGGGTSCLAESQSASPPLARNASSSIDLNEFLVFLTARWGRGVCTTGRAPLFSGVWGFQSYFFMPSITDGEESTQHGDQTTHAHPGGGGTATTLSAQFPGGLRRAGLQHQRAPRHHPGALRGPGPGRAPGNLICSLLERSTAVRRSISSFSGPGLGLNSVQVGPNGGQRGGGHLIRLLLSTVCIGAAAKQLFSPSKIQRSQL